jgi:MFS family permease
MPDTVQTQTVDDPFLPPRQADSGVLPTAELTAQVHRKVFRHIVPFLMLCYVISYLDRVNIAFAKLQISQNRSFSESVFGLGAGVFFIGYFVFGLPSNLMMQKVGARNWLAGIMALWGLCSATFIFVTTPASYYILRFLLGAAEAGFFPGVILYLTLWFPAYRRARIVALFMTAVPAAGLFGNPLSGWIMSACDGSFGMRGWQWMFVIEALPAILAGMAALFILDDCIPKANWLTEDEKKYLAAEIERSVVGHKDRLHTFSDLMKNGRVWLLCMLYFSIIMGLYGITFWLPTLVHASGVRSTVNIGLLSAIPFLCAIVAMNLIGRSSDAMRERRWHIIVPALVAAVGFVVSAAYAQNTTISLIFLSLATAGVMTCTPLFWPLPTSVLSGTAAAAGIALINSVGNLAGFVSPSLIGYLKDAMHSNVFGMDALAAIMVLSAFLVWLVPAKLVKH